MAIRKKFLVFWLLVLSAGALHAQQWRNEVARLFSAGPDYEALVEYLAQNIVNLEDRVDRADAAGILAYCYGRRNDAQNELRWIVEYFETYKAKDSGYSFLDLAGQTDVIGRLNAWKNRYPFITEIALIKGVGDEVLIPQGILPLVINIRNEAFYKFALDSNVLEGGQFKPGFNIIALDANELFINSGKRTYVLELKSGGLVLKKEITLDIDVYSPRMEAPKTWAQPGRPVEYAVSMYVGGELVMTSRKTENPVSWKLGVKPSNNPYGITPDYYVNRKEPNPMNSFSILNAIAAIYSLLKDLLKKKDKKDVEPPKIQTVQDLTLMFKQKDSEGRVQETRISIRLRTKNLIYVLSVP